MVTGTATLSGNLNVSLGNGFVPALGNSFQVITFASATGSFATATGLALGNDHVLDPSLGAMSLTLTVNPVAGPFVTTLVPSGSTNVGQIDVTFSKAIQPSTLTSSQVTLTGPGGVITVDNPVPISGTTYQIDFASQSANGTYTVQIGTGVTDLAGDPIDQNQDGDFGGSDDGFTGSFTIGSVITIKSDASILAAASGPGTASSAVVSMLDAGDTTGLTFVPVLEGAFGSFTPVPPGVPSGTEVINIPPGDGESGFFETSFVLPAGFTNPVLTGVGNVDNIGRVFLNGNPISPDLSDPNALTEFGNTGFSTNDAAFFVPGQNTLLIADDNTGGPSGAAFFATITFGPPLPDLTVSDVSGPATGFNSQSVLVSWTDQNMGTAAATGPWIDNIYAATDAQGDNPTLIGSLIVTPGVDRSRPARRSRSNSKLSLPSKARYLLFRSRPPTPTAPSRKAHTKATTPW